MPEPLFYVEGQTIYQRPVRGPFGGIRLGFAVCDARDGVDVYLICAMLNATNKPEPDEPEPLI